MRNIYLDFDGTIIDSSARLYEVYKSIMLEFGYPYLAKDEYWDLKRERQPYSFILSKTASEKLAPEYMKRFLSRIETLEFLKFDQLFDGALETLSELKKNNRLALVTLRRLKENLYQELKNLRIFGLFDDIFANFKEGVDSWKVAASSVKKDPKFAKENSVIVGDTEDTVLAAGGLGISSFLVLNGIRSREFIKKYNPDYILKDLNELPHYLT